MAYRLMPGATLFDRAARISARAVGAPAAFVSIRQEKRLRIIGEYGLFVRNFDETWSVVGKLVRPVAMTFVRNVRKEPALAGHPLFLAAPYIRSLAHVPAVSHDGDIDVAISILDPTTRWPFSAKSTSMLQDMAMLVADAIEAGVSIEVDETYNAHLPSRGFEERGDGQKQAKLSIGSTLGNNTAGQFLLDTLVKKTAIRGRNDLSYLTIRNWRSSIKEHQIDALKILKKDPDPEFVSSVAAEFKAQVTKLFGQPKVCCVVPVPCSHSKGEKCMSVEIASTLAAHLDVPFVEAFERTTLDGSSHPKNSARMKPPKLATNEQFEAVLLVDDVATSGRHLELAVAELRKISRHVTAISWIGN